MRTIRLTQGGQVLDTVPINFRDPKSAPNLPRRTAPKSAQNLTLPAPKLQSLPIFRSNNFWTDFNPKFRPPCFFYKSHSSVSFFLFFILEKATDTCRNTLSYHTCNYPLLKDHIQHRPSICRQRLDKFQPLSGTVIEKKSFVFAGQGSVLKATTAS